MDLKEEEILGENALSHWYYVAKEKALTSLIRDVPVNVILDVGAGSGIFAKKLLQDTQAREAICIDRGYRLERAENFSGKIIRYRKNIAHSDADLVLFLDVIEHVEDDVSFLREYTHKINLGTHCIISAPAFPFLFSGHDIFLNHYRRYTIDSLESSITAAGLRVVKSRYFFLLLFPLMAIVRIISKIRITFSSRPFSPRSHLRYYGPLINRILISLNKAELLIFPFNRLAGLTVFCIAVKE